MEEPKTLYEDLIQQHKILIKRFNQKEKETQTLQSTLQEIKELKESQNIKDDVYKMICNVLSEVEE